MSGPTSVDELVEREPELNRVDDLLAGVRSGAGAVLVVEGPAGIGKSGLLAAVRNRAHELGFGLLQARGSEFEAEMPFGVVRQLLEPMLRAASAGERRRLLDGVARVGARVLGVEPGEPPIDRFAAIHGLYWLCANRAERGPVVLAVDDVHWIDDPSLAWLGYLARRARDLTTLLVLGLRSGDPGGARAELQRLLSEEAVQRIVLGPLSSAGVGEIVRARLDAAAEPGFCAACAELTRGNPLFVRELVAAARGEGLPARSASVPALQLIAPAAIGTSVLARLGRLGPDAVALARAVAVLGVGAEVVVAADLAELDPVVAELTADRLTAAQILGPARPVEFFHPLIGAAVREDLAPGARRIAHRRAAAIVQRNDGSPARVASHLLACAPAGDEWVVERLRAAAREALEHGAPDTAAGYLRRALAEPPADGERAALHLLLGTAEWRSGESQAISHLEHALELAGDDDRGTLLATSFLLGVAYLVTGRGAEYSVSVLERALAALGDGDAVLALTIQAATAVVGMMNDRTAPDALRRAATLAGRVDELEHPPVYLLVMLANWAARDGRAAQARELAQRALACEPYPPPLDIAIALIAPLTLIESYDLLDRLCADLFAAARHRGAMREMVGIAVLRASASANRGALAEAEADARWALERAEGMYATQAASELIRVLVERDELDEAEDQLARSAEPPGSNSVEVARLLMARGRLRAAQGRLPEGLEDLLECGERCERLGLMTLGGGAWRGEAALIHAALGDAGEARRLSAEQLELAQTFGRPRTLGVSLRARGLVEGGAAGVALLSDAVRVLEDAQAPLELARALTDHGAALRRAGQRIQARGQLQRGLDLAHHCGARRIAALARAELVAAGAKPRRDAITGRDALTAGELRVARLAADGLRNREIAQALFITTKTASTHLSHAYRKLDITRRGQLVQALSGRLGDAAGPGIS